MASNQKQTSSAKIRIQKPVPDESIREVNKSPDVPLTKMRFAALNWVLRLFALLYVLVLFAFCVSFIVFGIVPSTEILVLMTLPGYILATIVGAFVGSSIDR